MKYQDIATGDKDDVYLVTLASVSDPDVEFFTFCKGTSELAMLLLLEAASSSMPADAPVVPMQPVMLL